MNSPTNTTNLLKLRLLRHFSPAKSKRQEYKQALEKAEFERKMKRAKWGVAYSVFDGEELLEGSIRSIRSHVDCVIVVWQKVSWYGTPADDGLLPFLEGLKEKGLVDKIVEYKPDLKLKPIKNETRKRNLGLKEARKMGVTHYMCMDTDEFYLAEDLEASKEFIIRNSITHSYCALLMYGESPETLILEQRCCCQYFSRITFLSRHQNEQHAIALVDPSRKISLTPWWQGGSKCYFLHNVRMHHYAYIRRDIERKMNNSSNRNSATKSVNYCSTVDPSKIIIARDHFGIGKMIQEWGK